MWVGPRRPPLLAEAIERGGGTVTADGQDASAIVWHGRQPSRIRGILHPGIEWVQLDAAGIDRWLDEGLVDRNRRWTAVHAVYAPDVAEHAVAFVLAAARRFPQAARRTEWRELDERCVLERAYTSQPTVMLPATATCAP